MNVSAQIHIETLAHVTQLRWSRPPHNHLEPDFLERLADQLDALDRDPQCRAVVLSAAGKVFSAGADFGADDLAAFDPAPLYQQAMRLFRTRKPMIAAVQGPAIGAGLGLALVADFRVAAPAARFAGNFVRLGFHPGFGVSHLLPRLVGPRHAAALLYTGRRIDAAEALRIGLVDALATDETDLLRQALALAAEIATAAPAAVLATRATLRFGLAEQVEAANRRELELQREHFRMADFREGITAARERREPRFRGE